MVTLLPVPLEAVHTPALVSHFSQVFPSVGRGGAHWLLSHLERAVGLLFPGKASLPTPDTHSSFPLASTLLVSGPKAGSGRGML